MPCRNTLIYRKEKPSSLAPDDLCNIVSALYIALFSNAQKSENPLKRGFNLNFISSLLSYRAENTLPLNYRGQSVNDI